MKMLCFGLLPSAVAFSAAASPKNGVWDLKGFLNDAPTLAGQLPAYLGAYVGPRAALPPTTTEAVMLTMNAVDPCPYCTGLHGELARMAGTSDDDYESPPVTYAKAFAAEAGRSGAVEAAYDALVVADGAARARSTRALCWMLHWGKTTGNSINRARDSALNLEPVTPFDAAVVAFYGPLFAVIGALNVLLARLPKIPEVASSTLGAALWVPQALHVGAMGAACLPLKLFGKATGWL